MNTNKTLAIRIVPLLTLAMVMFAACKDNKPDPGGEVVVSGCELSPQDFPGQDVTGIKFPEDTAVIYGWLTANDTDAIAHHAWGIWAGLTAASKQKCGGETLPIYETWFTANELQADMKANKPFDPNAKKFGRAMLSRPSQHHHAAFLAGTASASNPVADTSNLWVTVAYSPAAAKFALENQIFSQTSLQKYNAGPDAIGSIPAFMPNSITTKPTYLLAPNPGNALIEFPVWPGTPAEGANIPSFKPYWKFVMIDPTNSAGNSATPTPITAGALDNADSVKAATVNLDQFIHYRMDAEMAARFKAANGESANVGDIAILAGMHVGTKEISNWTWQTFFWAPNPDSPPTPSSSKLARVRKSHTLSTAAAHYAAVPIYSMVTPNQLITGGTNVNVQANIGYNPYLEPNLGNISIPNQVNQLNPNFMWGVQSNCMTCHALATVNADSIFSQPNKPNSSLSYSADQYISMDDPMFFGWIQVDFAWSINANAFVPKAQDKATDAKTK